MGRGPWASRGCLGHMLPQGRLGIQAGLLGSVLSFQQVWHLVAPRLAPASTLSTSPWSMADRGVSEGQVTDPVTQSPISNPTVAPTLSQ